MSDDLGQRHGPDRTRIDISQDHEVRYWTARFGVSREELQRAVDKVGVMIDDVAKELARH